VKSWTNGHFDKLNAGRIQIQPWQAIPEQMAALGLTDADGMTQVWFVDSSKDLTGGAEAINRALRYCYWLRPFTTFYSLPGIKQLQDWVYRWVAQNRYRLPGSTPQCKLPSKEVKSNQ
jgi:predicted DCC family thiol-disulfide oxidoreductase YuxK